MNLKDFLKDKKGLLLFNFTFLFLTVLVIFLSPIKNDLLNTVIYICILNISLMAFYLFISFFRKNRFINSLNNSLDSSNINDISILSTSVEESIYLNLINGYRLKYEEILDINSNKLIENKEIMEMWVHDIKMPIAIIKLIIEQNTNPYFDKTLDEIDSEIMRIENSVERVLYLSRLEDFHKDFLVQEVNLQNTIREAIKKYSKYFISNKILLTLDNIDYNVLSDRKWLSFIFDQLIGNALKYTNTSDSISIIGHIDSSYIIIKIKDTGFGIKKEDLSRVFNKGFTGNNGRYNSKSTGLGLYLVKKLCVKLNHEILIDSIYEEYTEFKLKLKLVKKN